MLIRNRKKPIAISARAILRSGTVHKYWSSFDQSVQEKIESTAEKFYGLLFKPEAETPLKTLDVPLGGSVSPVDALSLLLDFLLIAGNRAQEAIAIDKYPDDSNGESTLRVLLNSLDVLNRITGNNPSSLGLHTGVYFYNERGKHSRFLFLGIVQLFSEKIRNNDTKFFKEFTEARNSIESFLIDNKSLIGIILQNLSKAQRIPRMRDLFVFLVGEFKKGTPATPEAVIIQLGLRGRIFDVNAIPVNTQFSDDTKSMIYVRSAIQSALKCPICSGLLEPRKSVSYDHKIPVRDGGVGDPNNGQLVHPFCNTGIKS